MFEGWQQRNRNITGLAYDKKTRILSAGCGTGKETVVIATIFPQAEILAIDLSSNSLAYAIRKAEEYGIKNVTFRQADILRLGCLEQKFDYIVSMGVLHHLQEPLKGWRVLCDLLEPGGLMMIGLYSKIGRKSILEAQDIAKQNHYSSDADSMRAFRRKTPQLLGASTLQDIANMRDYYYLNMYRDLLFHVQEHDYNLLEIEDMLKKLKLNFTGFSLLPDVLKDYNVAFPDDPAMTNLKNWHLFEEKHPRTFKDMYYLWCRKEAK
jgi:trans-aconitate methyltransferase